MKTYNEAIGYPFHLLAGSGLGISHSSLKYSKSFLPSRSFGQADVDCYINMATGNVILQDHKLSFPDIDGSIDFSYFYNSLNYLSPWSLSCGRKVKSLADKKSILITEADGREVEYLYDDKNNYYISGEYQDGKSILQYIPASKTYILYHLSDHITEQFDDKGNIQVRIDQSGNETRYQYDATEKLEAIVAPSGKQYQIKYGDQKVEIYLQKDQPSLLHTYILDTSGRLTKSITPDQYEISYEYSAGTGKINSIQQSDGSLLQFGYYQDLESKDKIRLVQVGNDPNTVHAFSYSQNETTLELPSGKKSVLTFNSSKQPVQFSNQAGSTYYHQTAAGQIEKIVYPDASEEKFECEIRNGLLSKHIHRDGTVTCYEYSNNQNNPVIVTKSDYAVISDNIPVRSIHYVYDESYQDNYTVLRYEISSCSRVTEYFIHPKNGLIVGKREFPDDLYREDGLPTLEKMDNWVAKIKAQGRLSRAILTRYVHDQQGRLTQTTHYTGDESELLSEKIFAHDDWGNITAKSIKYGPDAYTQDEYAYNNLRHRIKEIIGIHSDLKQEIRHDYSGNQVTTTFPNGLVKTQVFNAESLIAKKSSQEKDGLQPPRTQACDYDEKNQVNIVTLTDGHQRLEFYDEQKRLNAIISPSGLITTFEYNSQYRYQSVIEYGDPIDVEALLLNLKREQLDKLLQDQKENKENRRSYTILGLNDKAAYEIDAKDYLTEFQYDSLGNLINKIVYKNKVQPDEWPLLLTGNKIRRIPDRNIDCVNSYFYDADSCQIGEQDPAGYVTQYIFDAAGRMIESIQFDKTTTVVENKFAKILSHLNQAEAGHGYYFYNGLNQCVLEVDVKGYISTHTYYLDGKQKNTKRYYHQVDPNWYNQPLREPQPIPHETEDEETSYEYDDLRRLKTVRHSNGEIVLYAYDEMNHQIAKYSRDSQHINSAAGDHCRGFESRYDAWGQETMHANAFVAQQLAMIDLMGLSESEIKFEKERILMTYSERSHHDHAGLKIKVTDPQGHATHYYYDKENRPILSINASGIVIENFYNGFGEVIKERKYYHRLSKENLVNLTGGYIHEDIRNLIQPDDENDAITEYKRDHCGQVIEKTDPEGNIFRFEYDAFKRCTYEHLPVNNKTPSLHIEHQYDMRGLETKTIKTADDETLIITVEKKYDHYLGKLTEQTDEIGAHTKYLRDRLGNIEEIQKEVDDGRYILDEKNTYDAFSRNIKKVNANNETTTIQYSQKEHTRTIDHPDGVSQTTIKENVFGETIELKDHAVDQTTAIHQEIIQHAPDGQIEEELNGVGEKVKKVFDLDGRKTEEINEENIRTKYDRDESGYITSIIVDAGDNGLNLTTTFKPNAFGNNEEVTDPRGNKTYHQFDRNGDLKRSTRDLGEGKPDLVANYIYNAQRSQTDVIQGDAKEENQMHTQTQFDGFNRIKATVIDPEKLKIRAEFERDAAGNITKEQDPNGNSIRRYYNLRQQKQFEVKNIDAKNSNLTEWLYTNSGRVRKIRNYHQPVVVNEITDGTRLSKLKEIAAKIESHNDNITLYFQNKNNQDRFKVDVLFSEDTQQPYCYIEEESYDPAGRVAKKVQYANRLYSNEYDTWTTDALAHLIPDLSDPEHDRTTYHFYDKASRERFIIDQDGRIIEKKYNHSDQIIAVIEYGKCLENPQKYLMTDAEYVETLLKPYRIQCRATYTVYDHAGREQYVVKPNGALLRKDYDQNGNLERICEFKEPVKPFTNYEELVEQVRALQPNPDKDTIKITVYDKADRIQSMTDALGNQDKFERDGLGNARFHVDRNGQKWENQFDRAKRLVKEIAPETTIAVVKDENGKLVYDEIKTKLTKKTDYDPNGNTLRITEAEGIEAVTKGKATSRQFELQYDASNQPTYTRVPASDTLPVTIETKIIHNLQGKKIAECDEKGIWSFYIYDSLGRMIYEIQKQKAVTRYSYNAFNQVEEEYHFATPMNADWSIFKDVAQHNATIHCLKALPNSEEDRVKIYEYYRSGKIKITKTSKVFFYANDQWGVAEPETIQEYNIFGDCIHEAKLISPGKWAEKFAWYDDQSHVVLEVDENSYATYYERNVSGQVEKRIEYANEIKATLSAHLSLETVISSIQKDPIKDRTYLYEYSKRGEKVSEKLLNVTTHELITDENGKPKLIERKHDYLEKRFEYSATEKLNKIIHEDKTEEKLYYDERDIKIAETGVTRISQNESGAIVKITPLTCYKPDAFGHIAVTQRSGKTVILLENQLPNFSDNNAIIEELQLDDSRGLPIIKQNGEGHRTSLTYTPTRKLETQSQVVTSWKKSQSARQMKAMNVSSKVDADQSLENEFVMVEKDAEDEWVIIASDKNDESRLQSNSIKAITAINSLFTQMTHTDSKKLIYDDFDRLVEVDIVRDGIVEEKTRLHHTIFGDYLGDGANENDLAAYQKIDRSGRVWFSNTENGGNVLHLRNLLGHETLRIRSPENDLSKYSLQDLPQLLSGDHAALELDKTNRDPLGRILQRFAPIWFRNSHPDRPPTQASQFDRWDNEVKKWNSKGHETVYDFDNRNLFIQEMKPSVIALNDDMTKSTIRPITSYSYNLKGINIGITDAKNHTQGFVLDEAGQAVTHLLADGTAIERRSLDALGRPIAISDASGHITQYRYDSLNNVTWLQFPSGRIYQYDHDEKGNRTLIVDPAGCQYRFNYDARNNCNQRFMHAGQCTNMAYDRNHLYLNVTFPGQSSLNWDRNWFGHPTSHEDLSKRRYNYEYNFDAELKHQTASGGYARQYIQLYNGILYPNNYSLHYKNDAPLQDISYRYQYGLLKEVIDVGINRKMEYEYDDDQSRYQLQIKELNTDSLIRRVTTYPDALGRESTTLDEHMVVNGVLAKAQVTTSYDAADNRRHREITLTAPRYSNNCPISQIVHDEWNSFDEADRSVIVGGVVASDNKVQIAANKGVKYGYRNNDRVSELKINDQNAPMTTDIQYTADGQLWKTESKRTATTERIYNPGGWVELYHEIIKGRDVKRILHCDANEWPSSEEVYDNVAAAHMENKLFSRTSYNNSDDGLPNHIETVINIDHNTTVDRMDVAYMGGDTPRVSTVVGTRQNKYGISPQSIGDFFHDNNGETRAKMNSEDERSTEVRSKQLIYYDTTTDGWILSRQFLDWLSPRAPQSEVRTGLTEQFIYNVNGMVHGAYTARFAHLGAMADALYHKSGAGSEIFPPITSNITPYYFTRPIGCFGVREDNIKNDPLSGDYINYSLPTSPQIHMVSPGDTLESIAGQLYGDSYYAHHLAKHNGLIVNKTLAAGQILFLPQIIPNQNKSYQARPYHEFVGLLTGRLIPHLETPQPKLRHVSVLGNLIKIIAVGIIIAIAPTLAGLLLSQVGTGILALASGVISALGDAAVQGLAMKFNIQSQFSFTEMIGAGVSAGISPYLKLSSEHSLAAFSMNALKVGSVQVATQFTEMAIGLRTKFDAGAVAEQVASALIGNELREHLGGKFDQNKISRKIVTNTATTAVSTVIGSGVTRTPPNIQNMAAQAISGTVSDEINGALVGSQESESIITEAEEAANSMLPEAKLNLSNVTGNDIQNAHPTRAQRWQQESEKRGRWNNKSEVMKQQAKQSSAPNAAAMPSDSPKSNIWHDLVVMNRLVREGISEHFNALFKQVSNSNEYAITRLTAAGELVLDGSMFIPVVGEVAEVFRGSNLARGLSFWKRARIAIENSSYESVSFRQARMLEKNTGYNISPEKWFNKYPTIGVKDTYITDYRAIAEVLGPVRPNSQFKLGLFSGPGKVSYYKARKLEKALGLEEDSLKDGFRLTRVSNITQRSPRSPISGNEYFLGGGRGLPSGGPELTITPLSTNPWPPRKML